MACISVSRPDAGSSDDAVQRRQHFGDFGSPAFDGSSNPDATAVRPANFCSSSINGRRPDTRLRRKSVRHWLVERRNERARRRTSNQHFLLTLPVLSGTATESSSPSVKDRLHPQFQSTASSFSVRDQQHFFLSRSIAASAVLHPMIFPRPRRHVLTRCGAKPFSHAQQRAQARFQCGVQNAQDHRALFKLTTSAVQQDDTTVPPSILKMHVGVAYGDVSISERREYGRGRKLKRAARIPFC